MPGSDSRRVRRSSAERVRSARLPGPDRPGDRVAMAWTRRFDSPCGLWRRTRLTARRRSERGLERFGRPGPSAVPKCSPGGRSWRWSAPRSCSWSRSLSRFFKERRAAQHPALTIFDDMPQFRACPAVGMKILQRQVQLKHWRIRRATSAPSASPSTSTSTCPVGGTKPKQADASRRPFFTRSRVCESSSQTNGSRRRQPWADSVSTNEKSGGAGTKLSCSVLRRASWGNRLQNRPPLRGQPGQQLLGIL